MPQTEEVCLIAGYLYRLCVLVGAENCGLGSLLKEDCIVIKEAVLKVEIFAVAQRIFDVGLLGAVAGFGQIELAERAHITEVDVIVIVGKSLCERYVEAGMSTCGEGKNVIAEVGGGVGANEFVSAQLIAYLKLEIEGVLLASLVVGNKLKDKLCVGALVGENKGEFACKTVALHIIALAAVGVSVLGKSAANGENVDSAAAPIGSNALPKVLGAVGALDGVKLGALLVCRDGKEVVFDSTDHFYVSLNVFFTITIIITHIYFKIKKKEKDIKEIE